MYEIQFAPASNKAMWAPEAISIVDNDSGEPIDLTGATLTIEVEDENGTARLSGSTSSGVVDLIAEEEGGHRFQWTFGATAMTALAPGTYRVGLIAERDGETVQLILGTLPVVDGIVG